MTPARIANTAICSGVLENRRAAAAGMMSIEVISRIPISFMAMAMTKAIRSMKVSFTAKVGTPLGARKLFVHRDGEKTAPYPRERAQRPRAADVDPPQIRRADREDVPEQITHQVHPERFHQADGDDADGKRRVRENAQQRIGREFPLSLEQEKNKR